MSGMCGFHLRIVMAVLSHFDLQLFSAIKFIFIDTRRNSYSLVILLSNSNQMLE